MKIILLANPNSSHTIKWAKSLSEKGIDTIVFGLPACDYGLYKENKNLKLHTMGFDNRVVNYNSQVLLKLRYLKAVPKLKQIIKKYKPDILHAHLATSYGLIGMLSRFHPYILSFWGSDISLFPKRSPLHKALIRFNIQRADKILSTSYALAKEINKYTNKEIDITPFGIDLNYFKPQQVNGLFNDDDIVIGTIKMLEENYGVEYLIRAFKILKEKHPDLRLKLLIVGKGSQEDYLKEMARELGIEDFTIFTGEVPYEEVPKYHNMLSVYVAASNSESFGVAVLEASACEVPVVVTNVGGLPEVVDHEVTGYVVPPKNPEELATAIERLIVDEKHRKLMGKKGREFVEKNYDWQKCVDKMLNIYQDSLSLHS